MGSVFLNSFIDINTLLQSILCKPLILSSNSIKRHVTEVHEIHYRATGTISSFVYL